MSNDQINAEIAKACGWTEVNATHRSGKAPNSDYVGSEFIPDYCSDLNAMHEAEKVLTNTEQEEYWDFLWNMAGSEFELCHANARQRAEAFLKTVGKWEEGE